MPVQTSSSPLVDPTARRAVSIRDFANRLRSQNPTIGSALDAIQANVDAVYSALTSTPPGLEDIQVVDASGKLIVHIGSFNVNTTQVAEGLASYDPGNNFIGFMGVSTEAPLSATATDGGTPDTITIAGHPFVDGDTVLCSGFQGDTAPNGYRIVEDVTTNTFTLTDLLRNPINGSGSYSGGGTVTRYYAGTWQQSAAFGGSWFTDAPVRIFADGRVTIDAAQIVIHENGATTILNNETISATYGQTAISTQIDGSGQQLILVSVKGFFIQATDGSTQVAQLIAPGDQGQLIVNKADRTGAAQLFGSGALNLSAAGKQGAFTPVSLLLNQSGASTVSLGVGIGAASITGSTVVLQSTSDTGTISHAGISFTDGTNIGSLTASALTVGGVTVSGGVVDVPITGAFSIGGAAGITQTIRGINPVSGSIAITPITYVDSVDFTTSTYHTTTIGVVTSITTVDHTVAGGIVIA